MLDLQCLARGDINGVPGEGTFLNQPLEVVMVFLRTLLLAGFFAIALSSHWTGAGEAVDAPYGCDNCTAHEASSAGAESAVQLSHLAEQASDQADPDVADTLRVRIFSAHPARSLADTSLPLPDPLAVLLRPPWVA